jgi:hypothetical protein
LSRQPYGRRVPVCSTRSPVWRLFSLSYAENRIYWISTDAIMIYIIFLWWYILRNVLNTD